METSADGSSFSLLEFAFAGYAGMLMSFVIGLLLSAILPGRWVTLLGFGPFWVIPILSALGLASGLRRKQPTASAYYCWILPSVVFVGFFAKLSMTSELGANGTLKNLLTADCSSSECLYEFFITTPLVCAVVYSAMARARKSKLLS